MTFDILFKFRIFDIFWIRINRIHSRITFLIGTVLFQCIETTGYLFRIFSYRLLQVTTGRRYRTDKCNRTCFVIAQFYISRTTIEVRDNSRNIHRESIWSRQLFHTVRHLTQSLCPAGSRVSHQQDFQSHWTVIFRQCHRCIYRCFTGSNRHVGSIGNNNSTLHQLTSCVRVYQFGELGKDFHHLIRTFTASCNDNDIRFRLLRNSMLKHRFTCTERTGNKSRTTFHNRIQRINHTYTSLQQFERTRFFLIIRHRTFYGPSLNHSYRNIITFFVCQDCDSIFYLIITFRHDCFYGSRSFHSERGHNFQRLEVFIHLSQPCRSLHFVTYIHQWYEMPYTLFIQRIRILSSLQENSVHLVEVILQTIIVFR